MAFAFEDGCLKVGYRRSSWKPVWYTPFGPNSTNLYYNKPSMAIKNAESDEVEANHKIDKVMHGEVAWTPYFNPAYFESGTLPERRNGMLRFLEEIHR